MEEETYHVILGPQMTHDFKVGNGLKQGMDLQPTSLL
jgi:hypothetical protein